MWRQCTFPCVYIGATWRIRLNFGPPQSTIKKANRSVWPFLHNVQLTAENPYSIILTMGSSCLQTCPFRWVSGPHLIHGSLGPPQSSTQTTSRSVQLYLHRRPQSVPVLYNGTPLLLKIAPSIRDLDSHLTRGSLGPLESSTQTASQSVQAFLQGSLL